MIDWLIDTNVLSETIKPKPDAGVIRWIAGQPQLRIASVSVFELASGIERIPAGKRRRTLEAWFAALLAEDATVLPFERTAAIAAATFESAARRRGRAIEHRDLFILATAHANRCGIATRNLDHFRGFGVAAYDPFADEHAL